MPRGMMTSVARTAFAMRGTILIARMDPAYFGGCYDVAGI